MVVVVEGGLVRGDGKDCNVVVGGGGDGGGG